MAKRRANNEGSIYKRSDSGWRAQVTVNGKRLGYSAKTQKECQAWLKETTQHIDEGFTFKGANTTLEKFLGEWLINVKSSRAKSTYVYYQRRVELEIIPQLGNIKLLDLKPEAIQRFYNSRLTQGYSNHAVSVTHKVLSIALQQAVKLGLILRNPCKVTTPPKPEHSEMSIYDEEQTRVFLETARENKDRFYALYYLALHTGMRQGEILGLKWSDLDFDNSTLQISRQVTRPKGGGFEFSRPKSKSGIRKIVIGNQMIKVLKNQKIAIKILKENAGKNWKEYDLIFPSMKGTPILNCNLRRSFRRLIERAGLPKLRFHDLRHTSASLMLNYGISVLIVSRRLGHSKPSITLDVYGHLIPSKQEEAAKLMDSLISPTLNL